MTRLDRYIGRELGWGVLQGFAWFGSLMLIAYLMGPLLGQMIQLRLSFLDVLSLGVCKVPETVRLVLPMATLFGTLIAIGRLSGEGELTAILASGISFKRVLVPVIAVGAAVSVISLVTDQLLVPKYGKREEQLLRAFGIQVIRNKEGWTIKEPAQGPLRRLIYLDHFTEKPLKLYGVKVLEYETDLESNSVPTDEIHARKAEKIEGRWVFSDFKLMTFLNSDRPRMGQGTELVWEPGRELPDFTEEGKRKQKPHKMSFAQIASALNRMRIHNAPAEKIREYQVEWHNKWAFPAACLLFALIGAPLGIQRQRTSTSLGLGISLAVVLNYYFIWRFCTSLGEGGRMSPALASWVANLVCFGASLLLLQRAQR